MHPNCIPKLVAWMAMYKLKASERDFFQMAYFSVYKRADARCEACFTLYKTKGIVPLFVRQFIQEHFITKGQDNESQSTTRPREGVQLYSVRT